MSCMLMSGCVQSPSFKSEEHAYISSNYPIVILNGNKIEKSYQLDLESGKNTLVILYDTYQYDYYCRFDWYAEAGNTYEVTDQENKFPLTLYRWHKKSNFWAIRFDAIDPVECSKKKDEGENEKQKSINT